jgi:hypothetical protein
MAAITAQEVKELLASPELASVEEAIAREDGTRVSHEHVNVTYNYTQIELGFTPFTPEEVRARLRADRDLLVRFGVAFLRDRAKAEWVEEYAPGEEPDADDRPRVVKVHDLACGVGITYLIYVYFLRDRPRAEFMDYLKKRRTPAAAAYARDVRRVFDLVRNAGPLS